MSGHADRDHALISPSAAHRWMTCTRSAVDEMEFPDTTSEAAMEGTLAHELCEGKLLNKLKPGEYPKRKLTFLRNKLKKNELWDDEMEGFTDVYVDTVYEHYVGYQDAPYIDVEKRLDLSDYIPEGFGTADCILISGNTLEVIDFKYGKGVHVDADHNPQMLIYALGAISAYEMVYDISTVRLTIIQPRLPGGITVCEMPVVEVLEFGELVREKASLAILGAGEYAPSEAACMFCKAREKCRARAEAAVACFKEADVPVLPSQLSDDEIGEYLRKGAICAKWLKDLEAYALSACLEGKEIAGYKAVEGRGSRDWSDQDKAFEAIMASGVDDAMLWERKPLLSPR